MYTLASFPAGFEPAISRFVVSRRIHWATGTKLFGRRLRAARSSQRYETRIEKKYISHEYVYNFG